MCLKILPILILPKSKLLNFSDNENNFAKQIRKQIYSSGEQGEEEEGWARRGEGVFKASMRGRMTTCGPNYPCRQLKPSAVVCSF